VDTKKISLYWQCQLSGWFTASLYWLYTAYAGNNNFNAWQGLINFIFDIATGILLTHVYRNYVLRHRWRYLELRSLLARIVPAIMLLALTYMLATTGRLYITGALFNKSEWIPFSAFFKETWLTILMTGIRLMAIWILAYHLFQYAQKEIIIAKENARLTVIAKDAELARLASQLNPHFLFNSLSNIKFLAAEDPKGARRAIDLLSELLRSSLYGSQEHLVPLKKEIELVKDYLELQKLRFEERLQSIISFTGVTESVLVPPLCIQILVENAIKHGIEKRKEGGMITISCGCEENILTIDVCNSGILDTSSTGNGLGLKNITERLQLQFGSKGSLVIRQLTEEEVQAILKIPVA
jgi:hypothetical protein